ncbi:hypothetical protein ACOMHN_010359 [Nucella lapillus]
MGLPKYPIGGVSLLVVGDASAGGALVLLEELPTAVSRADPSNGGTQWGKGNPPIGIGFSTAPKGDGETRFSQKATLVAVVREGGSLVAARDERNDSLTENGINVCVRSSSATSVPSKAAEKMAAPPRLMDGR